VELLNWIAALGLLVAIAVLLYEYDGHPIPDWPFGITLGALVSLLASFFTFALMGIITPAFSQVKWLWFRKERKMADFEYIENASRGPMASLMLLIRGKAGYGICIT
jgi:membrane protein YdbS with pleckstrin-like domain